MDQLHITAIQADLYWEDIGKNLEKFQKQLTPLFNQTDVVILPEMFTTGFTMNNELWEDMEGRTVNWMKKMTNKGSFSLCGSAIIKEGPDIFNRMLWVTPEGKVEHYDKKHLFNLSGEGQHYTCLLYTSDAADD